MLDPSTLAVVKGFSTVAQVRVVLVQSGRFVSAPVDAIGLQPLDATLTAIAGLTGAADKGIYFTGTDVAALFDLTAAGRALLDDANAAAQRTTLGLGTIATQAANNVAITGGSITGIADLAVADGGTGASTASGALTNLGITFGSYTPTLSNTVNIDSTASPSARWIRLSDRVLVFGSVQIDPTAAATTTSFNMDIPIASNFAAVTDLHGLINSTRDNGVMAAVAATDNITCVFISGANTNATYQFMFEYIVL